MFLLSRRIIESSNHWRSRWDTEFLTKKFHVSAKSLSMAEMILAIPLTAFS